MTNKTNRLKIIIGIGVFLLITAALFVSFLKWESKPDPASEKIIRKEVASQLGKEPNDLTDEDFAKITNFEILNKELSDIKLLEKFTNLEQLIFGEIRPPKNEIPKWKKFLAERGIFDNEEIFAMDLSPIKNLTNLQTLYITNTNVSNIKPLANLKNLQYLMLLDTQVSNIKPLKNLTKLQNLVLSEIQVSNIKPLANLKNLRRLVMSHTQVRNIKPLANLTKLLQLNLSDTKVSNIKFLANLKNLLELRLENTLVSDINPLANLTNLQNLYLNKTKVSDEQAAELKKALPNLKIVR